MLLLLRHLLLCHLLLQSYLCSYPYSYYDDDSGDYGGYDGGDHEDENADKDCEYEHDDDYHHYDYDEEDSNLKTFTSSRSPCSW